MSCIMYLALYMLSLHVVHINTRTSTNHWKVNADGKIEASHEPLVRNSQLPINNGDKGMDEDELFNIITSTVHFGTSWSKRDSEQNYCKTSCQHFNNDQNMNFTSDNKNIRKGKEENSNKTTETSSKIRSTDNKKQNSDEYLDCGKPVNFTFYDHLVGIANRHLHPHAPEPQVSLIFHKNKGSKKNDIDLAAIEKRLLKAKREKPKSVQLYNQIGNFWRVKGDTQKSIECFRRALAVSPNNAEVLLNLARVLFNLQYLDDAIFLTRRSLEVQPPDKNAWQQYFTLGEILKAYGHYPDAALHLQHALELKPEFEPAIAALRDMESAPAHAIHVYTVLIIVCLVLGVLLVILSSVDAGLEELQEIKSQSRHFNRAMAMRSLKMGISSRSQFRARRN